MASASFAKSFFAIFLSAHTVLHAASKKIRRNIDLEYSRELEACIDDERQFQTAKRAQAPGDATVLKWVFCDNFVIFHRRSKRIAFLESVSFAACVYMQIFNFRYDHVTTFQHPSGAYMCQMPGHRLSRLAKGTPSESRLSIGTIGLG